MLFKLRPPRYEGGCHDIKYDAIATLSFCCTTSVAFKAGVLGKVLHPREIILLY